MSLAGIYVRNATGFRLKAGWLPLPRLGEGWGEGSRICLELIPPHPSLLPLRGEGEKTNMPPKGGEFLIPDLKTLNHPVISPINRDLCAGGFGK